MSQVTDLATLRHAVTAVRRGRAAVSNLYATDEQIAGWLTNGPITLLAAPGAVLLLRQEPRFQRLYHVAESVDALVGMLALVPNEPCIADVVGREAALDDVCAVYEAAGFVRHAFLRRMMCVLPPERRRADGQAAEVARPEDAAGVAALLSRLLDPLTEQVPEEAELAAAARDGQLLVVRDGRSVVGMLLYDLKGQLAHLRYWHVDGKAHGQGIGRRLMAGFFAGTAQARRLVLWVMGDNERSKAIYRHYGFVEDDLIDRVMVINKDKI
jgi:ribosomal protein S18 acetylase RimI-like enzyme